MSIRTEEALKILKNEQQDNINALRSVINEKSKRYHQENDLKGSLKILVAAIEVLKEEQKKIIEAQILVAQNMQENIEQVVKIISAEKVEMALDRFLQIIESKKYKLEQACDEKINHIQAINSFLYNKFLRVLLTISVFIGGIGGLLYFLQLVKELLKNVFKIYW